MRRDNSAAVISRPTVAISTVGDVIFPRVTKVAGSATTAPAFFSPRKAKNTPIPAVSAIFSCSGIARTIACRAPSSESSTKIPPEMNTAPSAVCHGIFCPSTTV